MAYRDDEGDRLEALTAEGRLRLEVEPRALKLAVGSRTLHIVDKVVTLLDHRKKKPDVRSSIKIDGRLVTARDVPHEDLGIWIELPGGMRRIFGVEPVSLLEPEGLEALATLDRLAARLRSALADHAGDIRRAIEIGRGLDKVLLADHGDRYVVYARRLFRDRARRALEIFDDGRVLVVDGKHVQEVRIRSRHGVTVWGDYVRFAAADGADLARVSIPWIDAEDRRELARRIGQLVDVTGDARPRPAAAGDRPA
ncbi:MAG: hypothetical protein H0T89_15090 [Deltaproteobacteria bacterium]|nr:hypothetical protein [Deltaproteobacteria bacterium]MDQ3295127.1 hypothetical protein [Myxococcota bacterium]